MFKHRIPSAARIILLVVLFCCAGAAQDKLLRNAGTRSPTTAEPRTRVLLNQDWKFFGSDTSGAEQREFKDSGWERINLPHTWNVEDTQDDVLGYRMGVGWYRRQIKLDPQMKGRRVYLYFEGANQVTEVFVNGTRVGRHQGGYTAFVFEITAFVELDPVKQNIVAVKVDNQPHQDIPPSPAADFNLYGGIYRDVWLITTNPAHFTMTDYASTGIYVDTPRVSADSGLARVRGTVKNDSGNTRQLRIVNTVLDARGLTMAKAEARLPLTAGEQAGFPVANVVISNPRLWGPETPYLYTLQTQLFDGPALLDQVNNPLAFRWFSFTSDQGFSLNGKPYKLRGVNRHQDYFGLGNALPNELHVRDLEAIKDLGLNCVLLAHYPQDPVVLETADRLGLFVWEELPIVREISTSKEFADNSRLMLIEMIRQHYNHPAIIMWCLMNEVFLKLRVEPGYVPKVCCPGPRPR